MYRKAYWDSDCRCMTSMGHSGRIFMFTTLSLLIYEHTMSVDLDFL